MVGGVPVHNYDWKYPAPGSDAAQFIENGGKLTDWVGEASHIWIVELKKGVRKADLSEICARIGRMRNSAVCNFEGDPDNGLADFTINCTEAQLAEINKLEGGSFAFEEPDSIVSIPGNNMDLEGDSRSSLLEAPTNLWGLDRIDDSDGQDNSYDIPDTGGTGVHVYVHDTGILTSHNEFQGRAVPTLDLTTGRLRECNGDANCARDRQGHGTHCAGTIAGRTRGVARGAEVHAVKVLGDSGSGQQSWGTQAMNWLALNAIKPAVMSASLGGPGRSTSASNGVQALVNAGITVVVAAGNDNADACQSSPAFAPAAITVGATQRGDNRASYSNWGSCVDIFAPGSQILSAGIANDASSSTKRHARMCREGRRSCWKRAQDLHQ